MTSSPNKDKYYGILILQHYRGGDFSHTNTYEITEQNEIISSHLFYGENNVEE